MGTKKYLEFMNAESSSKRKTPIFHIFNKETDEFLGKIKWDCGWRQYVSEFDEIFNDTKLRFSAGCHREVADFIDKLMEERRPKKVIAIAEGFKDSNGYGHITKIIETQKN